MGTRILVVDDSSTMLMYHESILAPKGYEVDVARNSQEALRKIAKSVPDLVLLDVNMPDIDGIQCCRAIKSNKAYMDIKVIMVTGRSDREKIAEAFKAGCDDYVIKPVDQTELLEKVDGLLGDRAAANAR